MCVSRWNQHKQIACGETDPFFSDPHNFWPARLFSPTTINTNTTAKKDAAQEKRDAACRTMPCLGASWKKWDLRRKDVPSQHFTTYLTPCFPALHERNSCTSTRTAFYSSKRSGCYMKYQDRWSKGVFQYRMILEAPYMQRILPSR